MSLKARIEAVIYAAEEPVTLAQLAYLFREEAAASRAARLAAATAAPTEAAPESAVEQREILATEALEAEVPPVPQSGPSEAVEGEAPEQSAPEVREAESAGLEVPVAVADAQPEALSAEPEEDAKKAQRQRDREIRAEVRRLTDELIADYASSDRGLEIREVAGGFRMATRAEYHDAVRAFVKTLKPPMKLSLQALETLAVIAYKQPVTAPEIGEIRGVDSSGVLGSLIARKLVITAGRKQVIGRPILYKTTKEFLLRFGLKDLNELPSIEEFEKMASELAEPEETAEEIPFPQNEIAEVEEAAESAPAQDELAPAESAEASAPASPEETEREARPAGREVPDREGLAEESQP